MCGRQRCCAEHKVFKDVVEEHEENKKRTRKEQDCCARTKRLSLCVQIVYLSCHVDPTFEIVDRFPKHLRQIRISQLPIRVEHLLVSTHHLMPSHVSPSSHHSANYTKCATQPTTPAPFATSTPSLPLPPAAPIPPANLGGLVTKPPPQLTYGAQAAPNTCVELGGARYLRSWQA